MKKIDRLGVHEKICAARMATLITTINEMKTELKEMRVEMKDLRVDMSKGKGAIMLLIILGGLIGTIISVIQFWK